MSTAVDQLPTLDQALARGLAWLYTDRHRPGSMVYHLGDSLTCQQNRTLRFCPGRTSERAGAVIILEVTRPQVRAHRARSSNRDLLHVPLAPDEMDRLEVLLHRHGYRVAQRWNGFPATSGSLELSRPVSSSMYAARARYSAGCQVHPARSVFCSCAAWRHAYDKLIPLKPEGAPSSWTTSTGAPSAVPCASRS